MLPILCTKRVFESGKFEEFETIIKSINASQSPSESYLLDCLHRVFQDVAKNMFAAEQGLKQRKCPVCKSSVIAAFSDSAIKEVAEKVFHKQEQISLPSKIVEMQRRVQDGVSFMPGNSGRFEPVGSLDDSIASEKIIFKSKTKQSIFSTVSFSPDGESLRLEITLRKEPSEKEKKELVEWLEGSHCSLISNSIVAQGLEQVRTLRDRLLNGNFFPENDHFIKMRRIIKDGDWNRVKLRSAAAKTQEEEDPLLKFFKEEEELMSRIEEICRESIEELERDFLRDLEEIFSKVQ